jgi:hypothetical protein
MDNVIVGLLCIIVVGNLGLLAAWGVGGIIWHLFKKED